MNGKVFQESDQIYRKNGNIFLRKHRHMTKILCYSICHQLSQFTIPIGRFTIATDHKVSVFIRWYPYIYRAFDSPQQISEYNVSSHNSDSGKVTSCDRHKFINIDMVALVMCTLQANAMKESIAIAQLWNNRVTVRRHCQQRVMRRRLVAIK